MMLGTTTTALTRTMGVLLVAASAWLVGCGGSGSSGFDGAVTSEPEAIERALADGSCVDFEGVTYCASGVPVMVGDDSAAVDFAESSDPVPCAQLPDDPACTTSVGFTPSGFPDTTVFLGAWGESEQGPWTLSSVEDSVPGSGGSEDDDDVVVVLPDAGGGPPSALQIAVLVYLDGLPPDLPALATRLRGFVPDIVYLTAEVAVEPSSPGEPPLR